MASHTIELDDTDYKALERSARIAGLSVRAFLRVLIWKTLGRDAETSPAEQPGRWARLSQRVRRNPPLHGAGEYVRECSRVLREDFALTRDDVEAP